MDKRGLANPGFTLLQFKKLDCYKAKIISLELSDVIIIAE